MYIPTDYDFECLDAAMDDITEEFSYEELFRELMLWLSFEERVEFIDYLGCISDYNSPAIEWCHKYNVEHSN